MSLVLDNYIDGRLCAPRAGRHLDVFEPATGAAYARCPASDAGDIDAAVSAAATAFPAWSAAPAADRARLLGRIADLIEARLDLFAAAESRDSGKSVALARNLDIPRAIANLRFFAAAATQFASEAHPMGAEAINYTLRQPLGVVGCISPWNLPLYLFTWKIAPALAAGNCVVAKPSEVTPFTASLFAQTCTEAGLPPGVLNIVQGSGAEVGERTGRPSRHQGDFVHGIHAHRRGDRGAAAPRFMKVSLEMGGKNPTIVFADWQSDATRPGHDRTLGIRQPGPDLPVRLAHPGRALDLRRLPRRLRRRRPAAACRRPGRPGQRPRRRRLAGPFRQDSRPYRARPPGRRHASCAAARP